MKTLLLNPQSWDLLLDATGNIALASNPYAITQDAASACKVALGEVWYNTAIGIPYFQSILGYRPATSQVRKEFEIATLTVPETVSAAANITSYNNRTLSGEIRFVDNTGLSHGVTL